MESQRQDPTPGEPGSDRPRGSHLWGGVGLLGTSFGLKAVSCALAFTQGIRGGVVPHEVIQALAIGPVAALLCAAISFFQLRWLPAPWPVAFRRTLAVLDGIVVLWAFFLLFYGVSIAGRWPEESPTLYYLALLSPPVVIAVVVFLWGWWAVTCARQFAR